MRKLNEMAVVMGVMSACVCVTLAETPTGTMPNLFSDSFGAGSTRSDPLSTRWTADSATMDRTVLLAQAGAVGSGASSVAPASASAGVSATQEASTWSDMTSIFRPSRWRHPISEGGPLSWLNYNAWVAAPGRTAKVLAGDAIIIGAAYFAISGITTCGSGGGGIGGAGAGAEMPF